MKLLHSPLNKYLHPSQLTVSQCQCGHLHMNGEIQFPTFWFRIEIFVLLLDLPRSLFLHSKKMR